jgi:hypothetical protein
MTRPVHIDLPAEHRRLVLNILRANLPESTKDMSVRLAGDRPGRRYSDLDLAIDAGRGLTLDEIAGLAEAFSDSDLPYKVDLADLHNIEDRWQLTITAQRVALTGAAHPKGVG